MEEIRTNDKMPDEVQEKLTHEAAIYNKIKDLNKHQKIIFSQNLKNFI